MSRQPKAERQVALSVTAGSETKRLSAEPIERIIDIRTDQPVGWVYKWNTGETTVMWMTTKAGQIRHELIQAA